MRLQKTLVYFNTSIRGNEVMIGKLQSIFQDTDFLDKELVEDVIIELKQAFNTVNIYSDILTGTMDAFASIISNNVNAIMKRMTSLSITLMIPTLIASFYGMNVEFHQEDVFQRSEAFERQLAETGPFHVVMSDMAPQTTGTKFTDQARSLELCLEALAVAEKYLVKGGSFVGKIFMGPDVGELLKGMRPRFARVTSFKPQSSRVESKETFFVGLGFKGKEADGARD